MAKVLIKAGAEIDVPTRDEVAEDLARAVRDEIGGWQAAERTRARGIKHIRIAGIGAQPAAQTLYIPNGPASGYKWSLRLLSVQISAADTCLAYITSSAPSAGSTPLRLISAFGTSNANQVATFAKGQVMLDSDESVYLSCAAHNINAWFMSAWEAISEMEYRLL